MDVADVALQLISFGDFLASYSGEEDIYFPPEFTLA